MKSNLNIILAIVFLALAALACQAVTGGGNNTAAPPADTAIVPVNPNDTSVPPANTESPTQASTGNVLLSDNFPRRSGEQGPILIVLWNMPTKLCNLLSLQRIFLCGVPRTRRTIRMFIWK